MLVVILKPREDEVTDETDRRIQREKVLSHRVVVVAVVKAVELLQTE